MGAKKELALDHPIEGEPGHYVARRTIHTHFTPKEAAFSASRRSRTSSWATFAFAYWCSRMSFTAEPAIAGCFGDHRQIGRKCGIKPFSLSMLPRSQFRSLSTLESGSSRAVSGDNTDIELFLSLSCLTQLVFYRCNHRAGLFRIFERVVR